MHCESKADFEHDSVEDQPFDQPNTQLNLDFQNGYDCGDEPSDASEPEEVESSSDGEDQKEIEDNGEGDGGELDLPTDDEENAPSDVPVVTGDVYLLGGNHYLQSNSDST